jgi:hypothetical protein
MTPSCDKPLEPPNANAGMEEVGMPFENSQLQFFAKHQSLPFVAAPRSYAWTTRMLIKSSARGCLGVMA